MLLIVSSFQGASDLSWYLDCTAITSEYYPSFLLQSIQPTHLVFLARITFLHAIYPYTAYRLTVWGQPAPPKTPAGWALDGLTLPWVTLVNAWLTTASPDQNFGAGQLALLARAILLSAKKPSIYFEAIAYNDYISCCFFQTYVQMIFYFIF